MKKYMLLASMVVVSVRAYEGTVIPCMRNGVCGACQTSSCSTCVKLGSQQGYVAEENEGPCSRCRDTSRFCAGAAHELERGPCPRTLFIPRSQGTDTARELVGWEEFIHQFDVGDYYLTTGHVLGYYRSFRPERLAQQLFGDTILRFAGSQVADRRPCELIADNFGLSPEFRGSLTINPLIENIVLDNQFFLGLDPLACGLYLRFHLPLVHTRWDLRLCPIIEEKGSKTFPECYMAEDQTATMRSLLRAISGDTVFGDQHEPWDYGRILDGPQTKTGLADIDVIVGYDVSQSDTHHAGFYGQLVLPTGNRYNPCSVFYPMVGNARHVELGGGFSAHIVLYEYTAENNLSFWIEGNAVHMFKNTQMRSFDFCENGLLSRYMLLKELNRVDGNLVYSGNLSNAINFATRPAEVSIAVKGDVSAKFALRTPRIIADLGYNFYGRTKETLCLRDTTDEKIYAFKGTEGVCGLEYATVGQQPPIEFGPLVRKIPLNSSQHCATIRTAALPDNPQEPEKVNPSDIIVTAFSVQEGPIEAPGVMPAFESAPPVVVTTDDLCLPSGTLPAQATHKVFGYLGYNFYDVDWCYNPYLGIGGEAEFDARSLSVRSALNQWSVFIKGGFEF